MGDAEPEIVPTDEETLARATTALGDPEALFRANPRRLWIKLVLACGLLLYGAIANALWFSLGPGHVDHLVFHLLFLPPAIGGGLLWHMWRHRGLRVLIYPTGLLRLQHGEAESFPWDDIAAVRCKLDPQAQPHIVRDDNGEITACWLETSAPTFQVWNVWLELVRTDGVTGRFTAALADFPDLVELIHRGTFPHLWDRMLKTLAADGRVNFSDHITASRDDLRSGKIAIAWAEMKSPTIKNRIFIAKKKGAWVTSIARDASTIPNLHVLFALAAEQGVLKESE